MCPICQKCDSSLSHGHIPKFSPANDIWLGDIPAELKDLTIPEEKLISLYRHSSCVIKLRSPFHSATTAQSAMKGNCITFLQNVPNIVNSLPLSLNDLCNTIKIIFFGAKRPERIQLKTILAVRKKQVLDALHWLKKYNPLYQNVEINLQNIAELPENDVPDSIISTMEMKIGDEETPSERLGHVPDPLANPVESTMSDAIPIGNSGVLDVNGSTVSNDEITNCILHKIKNTTTPEQGENENVYLIPHSSNPVNEYFNPKFLLGLYPTLFCYGRGSPEDPSRSTKIRFQEHIRYLLSYNDRRFETNYSFMFVIVNPLQRRNACFHARLIATRPYFQASAQEIQSLNTNDIEMALSNFSKKTYDSTTSTTLNKLFNHIKTIGGHVMGSAQSRTTLRTRIHSLIYNQGLPSIFLTLNPADIHSPVALYFAGVKIDLDNIQMQELMTTYERAEIIASHPVATAKFFHVLITNILDTMVLGGVLGPVKAYFGTVENQGRGSLHLHLLVWLGHNLKPADMKARVQDTDFREKLKEYLEDIIKEDLDNFKEKDTFDNSNASVCITPTKLSKDNVYAALYTLDSTDSREQHVCETSFMSTPRKQQASSLNINNSPSIPYASPSITCNSPSIPYASPSIICNSPSPNKFLQTPTKSQSTSNVNNLHNEKTIIPACLPTPNPSLPNFASRFRADVVKLVEASNVHKHSDTCYKYWKANQGDKKTCRTRMPRQLIPFSKIDPDTGHISLRRSDPWINNFNEYLIAACRSNMDIKFIWSGSDAKALVYYITDYVTKTNLSFYDSVSLVQKDVDVVDNDTFHGAILDDDDNNEEEFQIQPIEKGKQYALVNTRIDYQYRSDNLNRMCLYDFVSVFYKKKMNASDLKYLLNNGTTMNEKFKKGRQPTKRYAFQKQHPQSATHIMMEYSEHRVPVLYGPQIPRRDHDDTRERYSRAILTLFVPWRTVADLSGIKQTWEEALQTRQHLISLDSWTIIENIQLLHECKADRDDHLLQVITEAQTENNIVDPVLLPLSQDDDDEYGMVDNDDLLELLDNLGDLTINIANASEKSTENKYIEKTIEAVENVGRFSNTGAHFQSSFDQVIDRNDQQIVPFLSATPNHVRLNTKWQEQLKSDRERARRSLITGSYDNEWDGILDLNAVKSAIVTVVNPKDYDTKKRQSYDSILPVISVTANFPTQKSIADEFTLNKEQRAALMIITSHLDGERRCSTGDSDGQLI
ncbi:unnamed protein product, partial [Rotaria magnacalcarata]